MPPPLPSWAEDRFDRIQRDMEDHEALDLERFDAIRNALGVGLMAADTPSLDKRLDRLEVVASEGKWLRRAVLGGIIVLLLAKASEMVKSHDQQQAPVAPKAGP